MTDTHWWADPNLPAISPADITCICGNRLDRWEFIPERHYPDGRATGASSVSRKLCPYTDGHLITLVYRAQRDAAGLPPPTRRGP